MHKFEHSIRSSTLYSVILSMAAAVSVFGCQSGSSPAPTPLYAYITNANGNSVTQCNVGSSGIDASTCSTAPGNGLLSDPSGIAFNGSYVYIINSTSNSFLQLNNSTGIYTEITPTIDGTDALSFPAGIAFNGSYVYIANMGNNSNSYTKCNVGSSGVDPSTCITTAPGNGTILDGPWGIAFNGNYAYFANQESNSYTQCNLGSSGIDPSTCITTVPGNGTVLDHPAGIAFNGNYAYFTNADYDGNNNSYTQCSVGALGIEPSTCITTAPGNGTVLDAPWGIAFNGSYAYIVNQGSNSVTQCSVGALGIESATCSVITPEQSDGSDTLYGPLGIAFSS